MQSALLTNSCESRFGTCLVYKCTAEIGNNGDIVMACMIARYACVYANVDTMRMGVLWYLTFGEYHSLIIFIYLYSYIYMHMHVSACVSWCTREYLYAYLYVCIYMHVCVWIFHSVIWLKEGFVWWFTFDSIIGLHIGWVGLRWRRGRRLGRERKREGDDAKLIRDRGGWCEKSRFYFMVVLGAGIGKRYTIY